jgi:hypothetical protein
VKFKVSPTAPVVMLGVLGWFGAVSCGGEWSPSGIGPTVGTEGATAPMAGLGDDLVVPVEADEVAETRSALTGTGGGDGAGGTEHEPRVIYLFYADGNPLPKTNVNACHGTPPKFHCSFGTSQLDCQKQIQSYLDRWYADFNVIFTFTRPTSGRFYTEVVSSGGGAWCGVEAKVAGVAPFLCNDLDGGVAYTFLGGDDAKQTAVIIAQEQAHLVGLEHTISTDDLLLPTVCSHCDSFQNSDNPVTGDRCNRITQNSYEMMKDRLGEWSGGPKPSAFGCQDDSKPPAVQVMGPGNGSTVGHDFTMHVKAMGDCEVTRVDVSVMPQVLRAVAVTPPYDWDLTNIRGAQTISVTATDTRGRTATTSILVNAPSAATSDAMPADGCSVAGAGRPRAPAAAALLAGALFVTRHRRRRR